MSGFFPEGLSGKEYDALNRFVDETKTISLEDLLKEAEQHVDNTRIANQRNGIANVRLAEAIYDVIAAVIKSWQKIPAHARPWCRGMIRYFTMQFDEEDDFNSPIGFDDDAEVVNACLRLAGLKELVINPEEYDNV